MFKVILIFFIICSFSSNLAFAKNERSIRIKELGSYYVGGKQVALKGIEPSIIELASGEVKTIDNDGAFEAFQIYVQYTKLMKSQAKYPLLMWHDEGFSGASFETTPDGREGWKMFFLRNGHDVYISDSTNAGRSAFSRYLQVNNSAPLFTSKSEGWTKYRIGDYYNINSQLRTTYPESKFPVEFYDDFCKQYLAYWLTDDDQTQEAYDTYISEKIQTGIILAHGKASEYALKSTTKFNNKIKALILIEPMLENLKENFDFAKFSEIPILFVFGDINSTDTFWLNYYNIAKINADKLSENNAKITWLDLKERGITGNTHMLMMDKNSTEIANLIQNWLKKEKLMK